VKTEDQGAANAQFDQTHADALNLLRRTDVAFILFAVREPDEGEPDRLHTFFRGAFNMQGERALLCPAVVWELSQQVHDFAHDILNDYEQGIGI
jgi:hypothetical protein